MKNILKTIKCYNEVDISKKSANDDVFCNNHKQLESHLNNDTHNIIFMTKNACLKEVIKLAFSHQASIYLNENLKYDFSNHNVLHKKELGQYLHLLGLAKEPLLLACAIDIVSDVIKNQIPSRMSMTYAKKLLKQKINPKLDIDGALGQFDDNYQVHRNEIKKYIEPSPHHKIKTVKLSYQYDLLDFLIKTNGIFILKGGMGTGKSKYGIIAYFEYLCCIGKLKSTILTPDIALSKQTIAEEDPRHYRSKSLPKDLLNSNGLVCCINSATTNDKFYEFLKLSDIAFIEEFEECALALSQDLIKSGKLSDRAAATDRFFSLLHKDKIIVADALFSDLSAQEIIKETGKDIYILESTDKPLTPDRTLTITSRNVHFKYLIDDVDKRSTQVAFSDQGQSYSRTFFESHDIVKSNVKKKLGTETKTLIINAEFLNSTKGKKFILNFEDNIACYDYIQISPALTSGLNFPFEAIKKVNLLASMTILPTQLIQSSGRFRKALELMLSFMKYSSKYHTDERAIRMQELTSSVNDKEFPEEYEIVYNSRSVDRVIRRIAHNNSMRQNYENNTLIMFELLGMDIKHDVKTKHVEDYQIKLNIGELLEIKTLQPLEYGNLKHQWEGINEGERVQLVKYEKLCFFNVLNNESQHRRVLEFDINGMGRAQLTNLSLCRNGQKQKALLSHQRLTQKIFLHIFELLNIDPMTLKGTYRKEQVIALENFIKTGSIMLGNVSVKVSEVGIDLLRKDEKKIKEKGKEEREHKGRISSTILKKHFGLKQITTRNRVAGIREAKYQICPESIVNVEELYQLVFG
jgi:hypothetical protein